MQIDKKTQQEKKPEKFFSFGKEVSNNYVCSCCKKKSAFRYTACTLCGKSICHSCRIDGAPEALWTTGEWYCSSCFKIKDAWKKENEKAEEKYLIKLKNILGKYIRLSVRNSIGAVK